MSPSEWKGFSRASIQIRRSPEAADSFDAICEHIRKVNPPAARKTALAINESAASLVSFPLGGRARRLPNTRQLVLFPLPYLIVYRVRESAVEIIRILYGAQQWP